MQYQRMATCIGKHAYIHAIHYTGSKRDYSSTDHSCTHLIHSCTYLTSHLIHSTIVVVCRHYTHQRSMHALLMYYSPLSKVGQWRHFPHSGLPLAPCRSCSQQFWSSGCHPDSRSCCSPPGAESGKVCSDPFIYPLPNTHTY